MKKLSILILCLVVACGLAACHKGGQDATSPTDVQPAVATPVEGDPLVQEADEDVSGLEQELDITIKLPEDFQITRTALVEGYMAQVEFTYDSENYTGRYAKGQHDNMSGFEKGFKHEETAEIAGLQVKLRWTASDEIMTATAATSGVADAYDAQKDLSYMIVLTKDSTKDKLVNAMTAFIQAASQGAPEDLANQAPATTDDAAGQSTDAGDKTAN